ncbi:lysophospholipid acyltransferase family protein [Acanthopleuribacter pedis]|uniref:1-acyl-sn-glycerol-3-phosphate acyltransferase n=1 Tax=Acanthopleuribacter pedis TaxID=442870 RepID=A0A8J7QIL9_9BACT|nr:lysophospholipid acyltransferase family protein [Acanthopleuribacter pedis]MBO1318880.1 1-acyl-sn-glycerol-3-phosphate acyltransferase [Acanthopleuribacter pedis]
MVSGLNRLYRLLLTLAMFVLFMVWSFALNLTLFPLIYLSPAARLRKQAWSLTVIHRCFRLFGPLAVALGGMRSFQVVGRENLAEVGPCLLIANHPTLIDIVNLMGAVPHCGCVVKRGLWWNPVTAVAVRAAGLIPNNHPEALLANCRAGFEAGRSLVIFPEGTRSPHGGLRPFTRGAAQIALRCDVPIVPVVITCDPPTLTKEEPWYRIPHRAIDFRIEIGRPVTIPPEVTNCEGYPLQVRALTKLLQAEYEQRLGIGQRAQGAEAAAS